ncbi:MULTISPECIES: hypothetical protein [Oceanobacillus]|uniref:Uncharacterized protein n=1 Tax=Oceanobacillus aidingensis TaxID=645964 RepID=A0ABV9JY50_9BACI|nr:hypothetical protein [Oceanobacillus oncorhynchi]MDM8100680.1 hypothetical protein [Oceanobacillus oncorhynchi]
MKKVLVFILCDFFLLAALSACQKEYTGEYTEWGEKTNSNATELLENHDIPYEIRNEIIYTPEDAFDAAIYCCS